MLSASLHKAFLLPTHWALISLHLHLTLYAACIRLGAYNFNGCTSEMCCVNVK